MEPRQQETYSAKDYENLGGVDYGRTEGFSIVDSGGGRLMYHSTNQQLNAVLIGSGVREAAPGHVLLDVTLPNSMALAKVGVNMQGYESVRYTEQWPQYAQRYNIGDHQIATAAFMINNQCCIVANEQRTGKTFSFIAANMILARNNQRRATLIIAPLTLLELVWEREILESDPTATVRVLREEAPVYMETRKAGRKRVTRKKIQERMTALEVLRDAHKNMLEAYSITPTDQAGYDVKQSRITPYWVIDPDAMRNNEELKDYLVMLVRQGLISVLGVDESTFFANHGAGRTKGLFEIRNAARYEDLRVVLMTGTPGNPAKVFAQAKLCDPVRCSISEERWMNATTVKGPELKQVYKPGDARNPRKIFARPNWIQHVIQYTPPTIRYETNDVIDVVVHAPQTLRTTLTDEQRKHYELAVRESLLVFENANGEPTAEEIEHAMTKITKARQIALGTFRTDDGTIVELDYTNRLNDIVTIIKAAKKKTIVFTSYTAPSWRLSKDLTKIGIKNVVITGEVTDSVSNKERKDAAEAFMADDSVRVMIAHPQTVAYGVEASSANTIIWNGPVAEGAETYSQGCSRCSSVKQDEEVFIYHLVATAYEDAGFVSLDNALNEREVLLNLARDMTFKGKIS